MNMETFLVAPNELHEAARIADGMRFLTMLKTATPVESMGGKFNSAVSALNTRITGKATFGKPPALAGSTAKALKGRIPKVKIAENTQMDSASPETHLDKEAFLAETLRGLASAGSGVKNSLKRDAEAVTESVRGYREGLAGDHGVDFLNRPVHPGVADWLADRWHRNVGSGGKILSEKPAHLDPTQHNGAWNRFKTRFAPEGHLKPEERLELSLKQHLHAAGASPTNRDVTSPEISRLKNHLNSFKRGQAVAEGIGTPALLDTLKHTMTNADGHVSPLSVLHGAGQMGWLDAGAGKRALEQSVGRISGASAEAAAAEKRKHMLMLGGGIAGGVVGGGLLAKGMADK